MRTVTFKSILQGVSSLMGIPFTDLNDEDLTDFTEFINNRTREGWEYEFWPELTPLEQRAFRDLYSAANSYPAPTATQPVEVYFPPADKYYQALQSTTGNDPATLVGGVYVVNSPYWAESAGTYDPSDWAPGTPYAVAQPVRNPGDGRSYACIVAHTSGASFDPTKFGILTTFERYIALDQTGQTPIGEARRTSRSNPRTNPRFPGIIDFRIDNRGIVPAPNCGTRVWLEFRLRPPVFSSIEWSASETNAVDDIRYRPDTTGECYICIQASADEFPESSPAFWTKIDFPHVLSNFVKRAAYADALRGDGQTDKAMTEDGNAYNQLSQASDVALASQGQYDRANAAVYA